MDGYIVAYSKTGIEDHSNKNVCITVTYNNMNTSQKYNVE